MMLPLHTISPPYSDGVLAANTVLRLGGLYYSGYGDQPVVLV